MERGMGKQFSLNANVLKHGPALNRESVANFRSKKKLSYTEARNGAVLLVFKSKCLTHACQSV